jgi:hypothetical protein
VFFSTEQELRPQKKRRAEISPYMVLRESKSIQLKQVFARFLQIINCF